MRIVAAAHPGLPLPIPGLGLLLARARLWQRRRRQAAMLRQVEVRLREDAALPAGTWPEGHPAFTPVPLWALDRIAAARG